MLVQTVRKKSVCSLLLDTLLEGALACCVFHLWGIDTREMQGLEKFPLDPCGAIDFPSSSMQCDGQDSRLNT